MFVESIVRKRLLTGLMVMTMMLVTTAQGETSAEGHKHRLVHQRAGTAGHFYLLSGLGFFDQDGLNRRLAATGYDQLDDPSITIGLGGEMRFGRWIFGGQWHSLRNLDTEANADDFRADISGRYWVVSSGFSVIKWRGLSVQPMVGLGRGTMHFAVTSESGAAFDSILDQPVREVRLTQHGLLLDAALGVDYRFIIRESEKRRSYVVVGFRGGYLFTPYSGRWQTRGAEVTDGPDIGLNGVVLNLNLGLAWEGVRR